MSPHIPSVLRASKIYSNRDNDGNSNCDGICGEYEVVDPNEISIAFEMPDSFAGTPEITVIGPGRSVSVNHLQPLTVQPYGEEIVANPFSEVRKPHPREPCIALKGASALRAATQTCYTLAGNRKQHVASRKSYPSPDSRGALAYGRRGRGLASFSAR